MIYNNYKVEKKEVEEADNKVDYQKLLENDFNQKIGLIKDKTNILHFSTGADSVASFLKLRENGIEPILIYKYFIPHLKMVDNYIDYFQNKFNVRIYQFIHPLFAEMIGNLQFQKPMTEKKGNKLCNNFIIKAARGFGKNKNGFDKFLEDTFGKNAIYHYGLRYTDGINRFRHLRNNGVMFNNKFYPIASFKISDIQAILKKHNCKLPIEYKLWGISFETPRAWNISLIKEHCLETYKQILEYFPLIDYEMYREKYNKLNKHFTTRLSQFKEFAISKQEYKEW